MKDKTTQAMQARARELLDSIASTIFLWGNDDRLFRGTKAANNWASQTGAHRKFFEEGVLGTVMAREHPEAAKAAARLAQQIGKLVSTGVDILRTTARDRIVKKSDLDELTKALNQWREPIRFHGLDSKRPPYRRQNQSVEAAFAETLLEYLNITARYGRVHWICQREECGILMTGGRGGKKYCSPACRQAAWAYQENKEYYDAKRTASRSHAKARKKAVTKGGKKR